MAATRSPACWRKIEAQRRTGRGEAGEAEGSRCCGCVRDRRRQGGLLWDHANLSRQPLACRPRGLGSEPLAASLRRRVLSSEPETMRRPSGLKDRSLVHQRAGTERAPVGALVIGDLLGEGPLGEAQGLDRASGLGLGLGGAGRRAQLDMTHARGGAD